MRLLLVLWLLLFGTALQASETTEVIQIMSRPAASLIEAVRPALGEQGGVSAFHDKLILRGTPQGISNAKAIIAELDRPARRLIIEVAQTGQFGLATRSVDYGVRTDNVEIGRPPPQGTAQIGFQQAQTRARGDATQRVQALDGHPALIMAGQSVPVYDGYQEVIGGRVYQGFNVRYRDANRGFYAVPRVHGDQVTVDIYQQADRALLNGNFSTQRASTILRGRLGDWLTLGAIADSQSDRDNRIGGHISTRRSEDRQLQLRVLPVD
jgi:hypothetical protein